MADEVVPGFDSLAQVLTDVRRYLGWHRDSAGEELSTSEDGALAAIAAAMSIPVTLQESIVQALLPAPSRSAEAAAPGAALPADEPPRLDEVRKELGDCQRCKLCSGRRNLVFGVGNPVARLVFVGEGPGAEEDNQGIPFVGAAGQLLTRMIAAMGYSRDEVYICNVVKCRPPGNRNPEPDEIQSCQPFLEAQLHAIRPEVIVALGKFAAQTLLRTNTPITRLRGQWRQYVGIPLMPTFHPAYLLRNPAEKKAAWTDLQAVMARFPKPAA
ncbi:MAG TPA: uracil-DNA glycosylase [Myxococcaceae bacterium]|nr:uracil-DNA glycosylase [Myxococcaceae bacterium]